MKIAISSTEKDLDSEVDARFGRCPYFLIVDVENKKIKKFKAVENEAMKQGGGAGITAAEIVGKEKVEAVITGNVGPRAFGVLSELEIEIYQGTGKIKEAVEQFIEEKLTKVSSATGPMLKFKR
jgi:predicted Fe-Mo cluster-binding NifX family protein